MALWVIKLYGQLRRRMLRELGSSDYDDERDECSDHDKRDEANRDDEISVHACSFLRLPGWRAGGLVIQ